MIAKRRAGIYTPCLAEGDAVGNDVVGMARVLACRGWDVQLFAETSSAAVTTAGGSQEVLPFLNGSDDVFIYHHSTSSPEGIALLRRLRCHTVVKYHNVTPSTFFAGVSSLYERGCRLGREQLAELGRLELDKYLADSAFDASELLQMLPAGTECAVIPPFHRIEYLLSAPIDSRACRQLPGNAPLVLSVGRVAPNKNHEALIESIGFLCGECGVPVRLAIVGSADPAFGGYVARLHDRIRQMRLDRCAAFLGKIDDRQLSACYRQAQVLVTTSLHEGFCVPVVEAMAAGVPVVAHGGGAVAETVGDAGIVWDSTDPEVFGVSIGRILRDGSLRDALVLRGKARFADCYATDVITHRFVDALESAGIDVGETGCESSNL